MSEQKCHHEWRPADDHHQCEQCGQTCPSCNVCGGATASSLLVCQRCLDREAEVLTDIAQALGHWQPTPRATIKAIRYDQDRRGGNADHVPLRMGDGPGEIAATLDDWCSMWAEQSRQECTTGPVPFLRGLHLWAAHNAEQSGWDDYRREMRQLRHRARRLAGLLPQRQSGSCIYCGGTVVRDWATEDWHPRRDGLSDELRCTSCRTDWGSPELWRYANLHTIRELPETHPEALVTMEQARTIFPDVPAPTWRSWLHRDLKRGEDLRVWRELLAQGYVGPEPWPERMPQRSWDHRGVALHRLADLTAHVEARASDARPGRKAS